MSTSSLAHSKLFWLSKELQDNQNYLRQISKDEMSIITDFMDSMKDTSVFYRKKYFTNPLLKKLSHLFDEINSHLVNERGFVIVKGFPTITEQNHLEKIKRFYLDFCLYLGIPLRQNRKHDIIYDVKSAKNQTIDTNNFRGPNIRDALPMHTDAGAILGMYCLASSELGGETLLSNVRAVHNEIQKLRPDLLEVLYQPFYVDRRDDGPLGALPYDISPIFAKHEDDLVCQYHQLFYQDVHKKNREIPPLSPKQLEALELFDKVAISENIVFKIKLEPGSIIFINNERTLHGRTSFDFAHADKCRYLLRIWLNTDIIEHTFPNFMGYIDGYN